jgi:hypothetical protein
MTNYGKRLGTAALLLVVAACGGTGQTAPPNAGQTQSAPTAGAPAQASDAPSILIPGGVPTPGAVAPGATIDSCALLSDADLLAATGYPVAVREVSHLTRLFPSVCDIEMEDGGALSVSIMPTGGRVMYETSFEPFIGEGETPILDRAVEGLGDKAGISADDTLMVLTGDTLFELFYLNAPRPDKEAMLRFMAEVILSKLPCIASGCPGYVTPTPLPTPEILDVCTLLTPDEIEAAVDEKTLPTEPGGGIFPGCHWPLDNGSFVGANYVELTVKDRAGRAEFELWEGAYETPLEHIPGIGDDAIKTATIPAGTLYSVIDDTLVTLQFSLPFDVEDPYALVEPLLAKAVSRLQ